MFVLIIFKGLLKKTKNVETHCISGKENNGCAIEVAKKRMAIEVTRKRMAIEVARKRMAIEVARKIMAI